MKEIRLTKGLIAKVDDDDYEWLSKYKWHASKHCEKWYAKGHLGAHANVYMHRLILELSKTNDVCDHKDGDGLNNQRSNLRKCTRSENQRNKRKRHNSKSSYKGITKT